MTRRNLILIHRGPEYEQDFKEISEKVLAMDPEITIYSTAAGSTDQLPGKAWRHPTLTVALGPNFNLRIKRGTVLRNYQISKTAQAKIFHDNNIPAPPMLPFRFGMKLDPILFGEYVIVKPMDLALTSRGDGVQLFRRKRLETLSPQDFPPHHPIYKDREGYLVQRFVDTGLYPSFYRVQTFFQRVIYSWHSTLKVSRCSLDAPDDEIEKTTIASQGGAKDRELIKDPDILALAERVHRAIPAVPMLAVDVIKEAHTGKLFVLECNPGGNTWHFSSKIGEKLRLGFGNAKENGPKRANQIARKMFIDQYGAFDVVASVLVEKTRQRAT